MSHAVPHFSPASVTIVADDVTMKVPPAATVVDVPVPANSIGANTLRVIARDASGTVAVSNVVTFNVGSSQVLTGIEVAPQILVLRLYGRIGSSGGGRTFGPDIERDMSTAAAGTTYLSANTNVARVDANGRVSAVRSGSAGLRCGTLLSRQLSKLPLLPIGVVQRSFPLHCRHPPWP